MADKLTPQQYQAVTNRGGKLLVSAAAGSGKTKVLVDRLLSYILDEAAPANIDDFLMITYTKAAAAELRGKISAKLSEKIAQMPENKHLQRQLQRLYLAKISTVHAFCADILREYAYRLDLGADFRVGDESECRELRDRVMEQLLDEMYSAEHQDADFLAFVDTQGLGRNDSLVPRIIERVYDSARCHLDPDGFLDKCIRDSEAGTQTDAAQTVWGAYLVADLFLYLDDQIQAMERCVSLLESVPELKKPAALVKDNLYQLYRLRQSQTWDEIRDRMHLDFGRLTFPKKYDDDHVKEPVKAVRKACLEGVKKKLLAFTDTSEQLLSDLSGSVSSVRGMLALTRAFGEKYSKIKKTYRILDFSDMEHKTLDLLLGKHRTGPTAIADEISERFCEILVDEYQDSNEVQDAIFAALTSKRQNLFMVGDVKQSIYQFRLADPGIFLEKYASFSHVDKAKDGQGRKVLLSSNFRSGGGVISAVNDVFSTCMSKRVGGLDYGPDESLKEGLAHIPMPDAEVELHCIQVENDTYEEESEFVAERIAALLDGTHMVRKGDILRPIQAGDVVILLRSPGSMGCDFQFALEKRGIPCTTGGNIDLLQTTEVSTLRALLQIISNPRQDIPLICVLASAVFGFTADELAALRCESNRSCMYDTLCASSSDKVKAFLDILGKLRIEARMNSLCALMEQIFLLTRLDSIYAAMPAGTLKSSNLQMFYRYAADYDARGGDLEKFLKHLELIEDDGLVVNSEKARADCVTIMSIHKSKGLEFPVVFLCGLSRRFNRESLNAQVLCDKQMGLGLSWIDTKNRIRYPTISKRAIAVKAWSDSLSEEMRVLYVAMTRARDRLIMTYASQSLEDDVKDIVLRQSLSSRELLAANVSCPGEWILMEAVQRTEAGSLLSFAGHTGCTRVSEIPWLITVVENTSAEAAIAEEERVEAMLPDGAAFAVEKSLSFCYPHPEATKAPSKQTATQRKGRIKDQEASEHTKETVIHRAWRKPSFVAEKKQGKEYGTAIHAVLQFIRYESCTDEASVKAEIERLKAEGFITDQQAQMVDSKALAGFFMSELGMKLRFGNKVLREFKFSILDDADEYTEGAVGEKVLLQGVVDCALIEPDGITVVDFKTDRVTKENVSKKAAYYRSQVQVYAQALSRIYDLPVIHSYLYFFRINSFIEIESRP